MREAPADGRPSRLLLPCLSADGLPFQEETPGRRPALYILTRRCWRGTYPAFGGRQSWPDTSDCPQGSGSREAGTPRCADRSLGRVATATGRGRALAVEGSGIGRGLRCSTSSVGTADLRTRVRAVVGGVGDGLQVVHGVPACRRVLRVRHDDHAVPVQSVDEEVHRTLGRNRSCLLY